MYEKTYPSKRFNITLQFLKKHIATSETILDLGVPNPFSRIMEENGYTVKNTKGEDLDDDLSALQNENYSVFTAFEIFEHLLNPYTVLKNVKCDKTFTKFYKIIDNVERKQTKRRRTKHKKLTRRK
jgi:hypothetical protein